jgi:hypothetical protein
MFLIAAALAATPVPSPSPSPSWGPSPRPHSIDEKLPGPESPYTAFVLDLIHRWTSEGAPAWVREEKARAPAPAANPVGLRCIETEGNRFYVGLEQFMTVSAPIERVAAILEDIDSYAKLFPGYDDVHVSARDGNHLLTFWEQHIPIFFVPNVKYEVDYLIDSSSSDRRVYRYQLHKSAKLIKNDGMIVLERDGQRTSYSELDFYDADWGIAKTFGADRVWTESVEGIYLSDVAILEKAENPAWSYEKIADESKKVLEAHPVKPCLEHKFRELR